MRYSNASIVLHWMGAGMIFFTFGLGVLGLVPAANTPAKLPWLWLHMGLGVGLLLLSLLRLGLRLRSFRPRRSLNRRPGAPRKQPLLARMAQPVQNLLYAASLLMSLSGLGLAWQAGYAQNLRNMPSNFYVFPLRTWHGVFSTLLAALVVLHLLTWAYYQFLRGENALAWMWFRTPKKEKP